MPPEDPEHGPSAPRRVAGDRSTQVGAVHAVVDARAVDQHSRVAVLGDMFELGAHAKTAHRRVGRAAAKNDVQRLLALGEHAADMAEAAVETGMARRNVKVVNDQQAAVDWLVGNLKPGDVVLVKGSRGMRMEIIVRRIKRAL